jgi:putative transposase
VERRPLAAGESPGLTEAVRIVTRVTWQVRVSADGVCDLGCDAVWCPKYRCPVLAGQYEGRIGAKAGEHGWRMVALEIMPDHVPLFVTAHPSSPLSRIASQFEGWASRRLRAGVRHLRSRLAALYSRPYCAATAGAVGAETAWRCIGMQDGRRWRKERAR